MVGLENHLKSRYGVNQEVHEGVFLLTVLSLDGLLSNSISHMVNKGMHTHAHSLPWEYMGVPRYKEAQGCDKVSKWTAVNTYVLPTAV